MKTRNLLLASLAALFIAGLLAVINARFAPLPPALLFATRWGAAAVFFLYAIKKRDLTTWIMFAIIAGALFGHDFPRYAIGYDPATPLPPGTPEPLSAKILSQIFLKLIKTIIAPLLFSTLVVGIAGHSDIKQVGRMGIKALIYFEVVTTIALFIGLGAINVSKAGMGIQQPAGGPVEEIKTVKQTASGIILHAFPENIAKSVADGEVLQIVVFSVIFGIALAMIKPDSRRPVLHVLEGLSEVMFKFTNIVMWFAPLGVGGAIAYTVGRMGFDVLRNLALLLVTLYVVLIIFILFVLLPIALIARIDVKRFARMIAEPASIVFATASSEAALPRAMEQMEAFGVPRQIVAFVMPTGYSFNLDGSTLYLALASVFVAQAAGIHLSFGQQVVMLLTLMLTSKGVAGIPRATLVILLGTADSFHLPSWPIFLILGIDALMDMARTAVNVTGNCLATAVIARWEGELGTPSKSPAVLEGAAQ